MEYHVVISKAGRDKGKFLAVMDEQQEAFLLCDGKERPLEKPKRKNKKHVMSTQYMLTEKQVSTNRALRKALAELSAIQ